MVIDFLKGWHSKMTRRSGLLHDSWHQAEIDHPILPLVKALNINDCCRTISSCAGHFRLGFSDPPFVMFSTTQDAAARVARKLDECLHRQTLNHHWTLSAHFTPPDYDIAFTISAPGLEPPWGSQFYKYVICRSRIDSDLQRLAEILPEVIVG